MRAFRRFVGVNSSVFKMSRLGHDAVRKCNFLAFAPQPNCLGAARLFLRTTSRTQEFQEAEAEHVLSSRKVEQRGH